MAIRVNADGSITVGEIPEEKEEKKVEGEKKSPSTKKPTTKKKK